jgi:hypothetical protein
VSVDVQSKVYDRVNTRSGETVERGILGKDIAYAFAEQTRTAVQTELKQRFGFDVKLRSSTGM